MSTLSSNSSSLSGGMKPFPPLLWIFVGLIGDLRGGFSLVWFVESIGDSNEFVSEDETAVGAVQLTGAIVETMRNPAVVGFVVVLGEEFLRDLDVDEKESGCMS